MPRIIKSWADTICHYFICILLFTYVRLADEVGHIQLSEMKSRLYLNLGLTLESQGDVTLATDYITQVCYLRTGIIKYIFVVFSFIIIFRVV